MRESGIWWDYDSMIEIKIIKWQNNCVQYSVLWLLYEIMNSFIEVDGNYNCGLGGILALAGSLLGLNTSVENQLAQRQQNSLSMHVRPDATNGDNPHPESQFQW